MYAQGGVTYTPFAERLTAFSFQKELSVRSTSGGRVPSSQPLLETTIFSLPVHTYSCRQSENIFSKCSLKRAIDPLSLIHI